MASTESTESAADRLRRNAAWLPALAVILTVAFAGGSSFTVGRTSEWFYPFWMRHFARFPMQRFWDLNELLRKVGHLAIYAVVSSAFYYSWRAWLRRRPSAAGILPRNRAAGLALISTLLLAAGDEIHQIFIPGRASRVADVGMDLCGAYLAMILLLAARRRSEGKSAQHPAR